MQNNKGMIEPLLKLLNENITTREEKMIDSVIESYIDSKNDVLGSDGLYKQLLINETEQSQIFLISKITPSMVAQFVKSSIYIKPNWRTVNNPFSLVLAGLVVRALKKNSKTAITEANNYALYMSFRMYASKFSRQFPYKVIPNIMSYTINNLTYKYLIKIKGTLLGALRASVATAIDCYAKRLVTTCTDKDISDFISGLDDRISDFVKNIADEYYKNHASGNYMNYEEDKATDDEFKTADNAQFLISRITDKVNQKIVMNGMDIKLVKISASMAGVSDVSMMNAINKIIDVKLMDIRTLIELLVSVYVVNNPGCTERDVASRKFFISTLSIYKKNNSNDKNIIKIKDMTHDWLLECSEQYKKSNREATLNNFKRALFIYFVLVTQVYSA